MNALFVRRFFPFRSFKLPGASLLAAGLLLYLGMAPLGHAEADKFLCIDGIEGSSTVKGYEGCSIVSAYSQSIVNRNLNPSGGGTGRLFRCGNASLIKQIDAASPPLLISVLRDTAFPSMRVHFISKDQKRANFLTIELKNVMIESVRNSEFSNGTGESNLPIDMERLALTAAEMKIIFTPQPADGSTGSPIGAEVDCVNKTANPL